jgi:hypothetical protein
MKKEEANFFDYEISNISQEEEMKESNSNDEIYYNVYVMKTLVL